MKSKLFSILNTSNMVLSVQTSEPASSLFVMLALKEYEEPVVV